MLIRGWFGLGGRLATAALARPRVFVSNIQFYHTPQTSFRQELEENNKLLAQLADTIRIDNNIRPHARRVHRAFRTAIILRRRSIDVPTQPGSTDWDIASMQCLTDILAQWTLIPSSASIVHSILSFASADSRLNVTELVENMDGDLPLIMKRMQPEDFFHLVSGLSYVRSMKRVPFMLNDLHLMLGKMALGMEPSQYATALKAFDKAGIRCSVGDVELLGFQVSEVGLRYVDRLTLASYCRLLLKCKSAEKCIPGMCDEVVGRASDKLSSLLHCGDWFHVLIALRSSGQLTEEVLEAVAQFFLPSADSAKCLLLIKVVFFAKQAPYIEQFGIKVLDKIIPCVSELTIAETCTLVRRASTWNYTDYTALYHMLEHAATGELAQENLIDLLYGLKASRMPKGKDVTAQVLKLVKHNSVCAEQFSPRSAVLFSMACAYFRVRAEDWLSPLVDYLEDHLPDIAKYSHRGLVQICSSLAALNYPIPSTVCHQLPNLAPADGKYDMVDALILLHAVWLCGDLASFPSLGEAYCLDSRSDKNVLAGVMHETSAVCLEYLYITAGDQPFNKGLPRFPRKYISYLAEQMLARESRSKPRWTHQYLAQLYRHFGRDQLLTGAVSEDGILFDAAMLINEAGEFLAWDKAFVQSQFGVPVIKLDALPEGSTPVAICIGPIADHCIATPVPVLRGRVISRAKALQMQGWKAVVVDSKSARVGADYILESLTGQQ